MYRIGVADWRGKLVERGFMGTTRGVAAPKALTNRIYDQLSARNGAAVARPKAARVAPEQSSDRTYDQLSV